jgi:Fic family protein
LTIRLFALQRRPAVGARGPPKSRLPVRRIEGKLTSSKWAKLAKCSQDTAHRDIIDLVNRGMLVKDPAGGRSTSYSLVTPRRAE